MTPIFWSIEESHGLLKVMASLNPFAYLVGIYRTAFVHNDVYIYGDWNDHIYFWLLTLLLLLIGAVIHTSFKKNLLDYV